MLIDGLEYDYLWIIVIFGLSFWRHPFTAEDSFSIPLKWQNFLYHNGKLNWEWFQTSLSIKMNWHEKRKDIYIKKVELKPNC